jgi:hypothetical protein
MKPFHVAADVRRLYSNGASSQRPKYGVSSRRLLQLESKFFLVFGCWNLKFLWCLELSHNGL